MAAGRNSGSETPGGMGRGGILGVRHPDGIVAERKSGCETPIWNGGAEEFRMECRRRRIPDVRHPDGMAAKRKSECEAPV